MLLAQESADAVAQSFDSRLLIAILVPAAFIAFVIVGMTTLMREQ
jgi:hypothetical protein